MKTSPQRHPTSQGLGRRNSHEAPSVVVDVSPIVFRCFWICILSVRIVSVAFLTAMAMVYFFLLEPGMSYYASLLGPDALAQFVPMGLGLSALAVAHVYKIFSMLTFSWRSRDLVFESPGQARKMVLSLWRPRQTHPEVAILTEDSRRRVWSDLAVVLLRKARKIWPTLFGRRGFFSVKSEFFDMRLILREFFEILSQTLQLQTATRLIITPWITNLYAVIVIVNCWSTPIVQFLCRRKLKRTRSQLPTDGQSSGIRRDCLSVERIVALERLSCLTIDLVLDAVISILVPVVIVVPYAYQFDPVALEFSQEILYDDVRFVKFVYEHQQVLAVNSLETMFTLFPQWSIFVCCGSLRSLLHRRDPQAHGPDLSKLPRTAKAEVAGVPLPFEDQRKTSVLDSQITVKDSSARVRSARHVFLQYARHVAVSKVTHIAFIVWGVVALGLHVSSLRTAIVNSHAVPCGCKQVLRPWLTTSVACSVFEFNCHVAGTTTPSKEDLNTLDKESLAVLIFSHCQAVVVPPIIHTFPNLLGFEIFNSSILEWGVDAAMSVERQRRLSYIQLLWTNMTVLPPGLVTKLPEKLLDIEISASNLSALPDDLHEHWHGLSILYIEKCKLLEFPATLTKLKVGFLSLVGNQISHMLSSEPWAPRALVVLSLNKNPLLELPMTPLRGLDLVEYLSVEDTAVRTLPDWIYESHVKVFMNGSAFCSSLPKEMLNDKFGPESLITCVDRSSITNGFVPIDFIAERRPLNPVQRPRAT